MLRRCFQRMMDHTVDKLEAVFAYMDDSGVSSPDRQTHLIHLETFFSTLAVNLEKFVLDIPTLELLGHTISAAGSAPMAKHTPTIDSCPAPQDIQQLQRFLGMVNFYNHFLPGCARIFRPLTDLLKGSPKTLE
jgi:cytoskeleton-associated protein 5